MSITQSTQSGPGAKLVLLGESSVGKTSVVLRFVKNQFFEYQESTIGAAFISHVMPLKNGGSIKFEIWDTAGQERYKSLAPMYYKKAKAAILVYDITIHETYTNAIAWVKKLQIQEGTGITIILVGNKLDLVTDDPSLRAVSTDEAKSYCDDVGILFMEVSAKSNLNVDKIFLKIAESLGQSSESDNNDADNTAFVISKPPEDEPQQRSCRC